MIREKKRNNIKLLVIVNVVLLFLAPAYLFGHGGGLNRNGCHNNRKTGDYHCHDGGSASSGGQSRQSSYGGNGLEVIPESAPPPQREQGSRMVSVAPKSQREQGIRVANVTDGDTVRALIEGQEVDIRLYGIDCPEGGQSFGKAAQQALKQILTGREISIKVLDRDRYGRLVALVFADGANVNEAMVSSGYAWTYPQYCKQSFCNDWRQNQRVAQSTRKGLWQEVEPIPPWEWRHKK